MNIQAVWTDEIPKQIPMESCDRIEEFMSLMDFMKDNDLDVYLNEDEIYAQEEFCDWIYSREYSELSDIKKELILKMSKCHRCDADRQQEFLQYIGKERKEKYYAMDFQEEKPFYAATVKKLYQICREYLSMESRSEFKTDMEFCFPEIYFDGAVAGSMNTLNRQFEDIRGEIVEHLTAINNYKSKFLQLMEQKRGYREIAAEFQKDMGLECSPQGKRKQVEKLKREVTNDHTGKTETVNCELHTKFRKYNIDRTKQDRIYFAPAKEGIHSGKTIVVHIGEHL